MNLNPLNGESHNLLYVSLEHPNKNVPEYQRQQQDIQLMQKYIPDYHHHSYKR
ncbi:hypothetical protein [Escherichia coli IS5]|nr:hypothetical protein [Escherichia coli IS5]